MSNQITMNQIYKFDTTFNNDIANKKIMDAIHNRGLNNFCINKDVIKENSPEFNIELIETKRMDQKDSLRCWIYSGLNFIKRNIAENLDIDVLNFNLSPTFIAFYDRLEKANSFYNYAIHKNLDYKKIDKDTFFNEPATEKGRFELFRAIINKYGIVPYNIMKDTKDSLNSETLNLLFNEKVKKDCIKLMNCKKVGDDCYKLKDKLLYEDYEFLCKIIGQPAKSFNFSYTNLKNEKVILKNVTPLEFKEKFLSIDLNQFISIVNIEKHDKQLYKKYIKKLSGNVYRKSYMNYINLPIERLKELATNQLKDGMPVIFDCETMKFRDKTSGVLDTRLYEYNKFLPFNELSRTESLNFKDIFARHVMTFTGVQIKDSKTIRWKVEDSYGDKEKFNGYYIMNDNWFEKFVVSIIVDKKYLNNKELEIYNSEPIKIYTFGVL